MTVLNENENIVTSEEIHLENDNNSIVKYCCCDFYLCKNMWIDCFNCSFRDPCCHCCEENLNIMGPKSNHQYNYCGRYERRNYCVDLIPFIPLCIVSSTIIVLLTVIVYQLLLLFF
jgi:hypothetical protein